MQLGGVFFRLLTLIVGIVFIGLAGLGLFLPTIYIGLLDVSTSSPSLNAHFRYLNGLFLVFALMLLALFRDHKKNHILLLYISIGMLVGGVIRTLGLFVDGVPNELMLVALVGEYALGIVFFIYYRHGKTPS